MGGGTRPCGNWGAATDLPVIGYVVPPSLDQRGGSPSRGLADARQLAREGMEAFGDLLRLGGLSRLKRVLVEEDIDTVLIAFAAWDRAEFFCRAGDLARVRGVRPGPPGSRGSRGDPWGR